MGNERILVPLDDLGMVRVQGPDALRFLQGQLSNDVSRLAPDRSLLAGYHNPQGRAIALLRLLWLGTEDFIGVLPRELTGPVAARLAKYVLRAKVKITDESSQWHALGVIGADAAKLPEPAACARVGDTPPRWLSVSRTRVSTDGERRRWHGLDIEAGQAQVFGATTEQFVAQMLNLDVLDAIAFDKGCYTGQEVIARAHYRGRVKRRMQRFATRGPCELAPGSAGRLGDGRPFKVVDAVGLEDGRCEFLAVAPLAGPESEGAESEGAEPGADPVANLRVDALSLPLPYSLPD
jgi:folate-binding protein YgfZ